MTVDAHSISEKSISGPSLREDTSARALEVLLGRMMSEDVPLAGLAPLAPIEFRTNGGSLRHLAALCALYGECLGKLKADFARFAEQSCSSAQVDPRLMERIARHAGYLLTWDKSMERQKYIGPAITYFHLGRGLGLMCCQRLQYACGHVGAGDDATIESMIHWMEPPSWFGELEAVLRARRRRAYAMLGCFVVISAAVAVVARLYSNA